MKAVIRSGHVEIEIDGRSLPVTELASIPEKFRGMGIPADATITYINLNQTFYDGGEQCRLSVNWQVEG